MSEDGIDLLKVVYRGVTRALNGHVADLPALEWVVKVAEDGSRLCLEGQAPRGDYGESELPAVLERWATHLDLSEVPAKVPGVREFAGVRDAVELVVWGVVDGDVFEEQISNSVSTDKGDDQR